MLIDPSAIAPLLLGWYDRHRRVLPWRALPGEAVDPYRVWLSEIMLQQTVAVTVVPYFRRFAERWPTVEALAAAPLDEVLTQWAGLGYYARARNLHRCACVVVEQYGGAFPADPAALRSLPGIGAYTAGAIAAIAFGLPFAAVDGNVERITARLGNVDSPLPTSRPALRRLAQSLVPQARPGDFAQAMMDLGATVCVPANPKCLSCPVSAGCAAFQAGNPGRLPVKARKAEKRTRHGTVYWAVDAQGAVLVRRRPPRGLLGGMMEFPSSPWAEHALPATGQAGAPFEAEWLAVPGAVRHTFTHFHLVLEIVTATLPRPGPEIDGLWVLPERFREIALPGVMRKVERHFAGNHASAAATSLDTGRQLTIL